MRMVRSYKELEVYKRALDAGMEIFQITKRYPSEEKYSLVDQIRRSSRSVCSNIAEAWRKRRYRAAFISKLSDAESESAETQVWLEFSFRCGYLNREILESLDDKYDHIISQLVLMIEGADRWLVRRK